LVLGICNGFQVLVKAGLLPQGANGQSQSACTITDNEVPGYLDRWVWLRAGETPCVFVEPGRHYELPIAHGEGRVVFADQSDYDSVASGGQDALCYTAPPNGATALEEPYNPNGSTGDIAGLCDPTGHVLGLMPHPERFVSGTQHPCWTSRSPRDSGDGLAIFQRAVAYFT